LKIRKAKLKDIKDIAKLLSSLFSLEKEFNVNKILQEKAIKTIIKNKDIGSFFVIIKDKKIIGCVNILYTISTALGSKVALLEDMIVSKKYRGKQFGTKLLKHTIKYLIKKKIKRITLLTDDDNLKAHRFYKKLGFEFSSMVVLKRKG